MPASAVGSKEAKAPPQSRTIKTVVASAQKLSKDEVRTVVGAKNVMGTCSG